MKSFDGMGLISGIGVVELREEEPLMIGRCKVRYFGIHTPDKTLLPSEDLPWSYPMMPLDHGRNCVGPREGDWVISIFLDGPLMQRPMMIGTFSNIPELLADPSTGFFDARPDSKLEGHQVPRDPEPPTQHDDGSGTDFSERSPKSRWPEERFLKESSISRLARNENIGDTIIGQKQANVSIGQTDIPGAAHTAGTGSDTDSPAINWSEPPTPYAAKYPYNHVYDSEAGHVIEVDDTPGAERVHIYHRAGSFVEIHPDGSMVMKTVNSKYEVVLKENNLHVEASDNKIVDKWSKLHVNKDAEPGNNYDMTVGAGGNINMSTDDGNMNSNIMGDFNLKVDKISTTEVEEDMITMVHKNSILTVDEDLAIKVSGNINLSVDGDCNLNVGGNLVQRVSGDMIVSVAGNKTEIIGGSHAVQSGSATRISLGDVIDIGGEIYHVAPKTNFSMDCYANNYNQPGALPGSGLFGIAGFAIQSFTIAFETMLQTFAVPIQTITSLIEGLFANADIAATLSSDAAEANANSPAGQAAAGSGGSGGGGGGGPKGPAGAVDGPGGFLIKNGANSGVMTLLTTDGGGAVYEAIPDGEEDVEVKTKNPDGTESVSVVKKPKYKKGNKIESAEKIKKYNGDNRTIYRFSKPVGGYTSSGPKIVETNGGTSAVITTDFNRYD